jgi:hypothetical protein
MSKSLMPYFIIDQILLESSGCLCLDCLGRDIHYQRMVVCRPVFHEEGRDVLGLQAYGKVCG